METDRESCEGAGRRTEAAAGSLMKIWRQNFPIWCHPCSGQSDNFQTAKVVPLLFLTTSAIIPVSAGAPARADTPAATRLPRGRPGGELGANSRPPKSQGTAFV